MPDIVKTKFAMRAWRKRIPLNRTIGFVPTMGALHEGHLSLVRRSIQENAHTVVSIFVNPLQFNAPQDLTAYPRTLAADIEKLRIPSVDVVFTPESADLYEASSSTFVTEQAVSAPLCGRFRPGHFRGVTTVVAKLFNLVQPTRAYFGAKDAQQCAVIARMVRDLDIPVELVIGKTVREDDGLAMSSRNANLSTHQRIKARMIHQSLHTASRAFAHGERSAKKLIELGRWVLESDPEFDVQYWEVVDPESLEPITQVGDRGALIAVATHLGKVRLIDNLRLDLAMIGEITKV